MSGVLLVAAGAVGLVYLSQPDTDVKQPKKDRQKSGPNDPIQTDFMLTGNYGDAANISSILNIAGTVAAVKDGVDLSGTPCRWIQLRGNNRCWYKTYNMTEQYCTDSSLAESK